MVLQPLSAKKQDSLYQDAADVDRKDGHWWRGMDFEGRKDQPEGLKNVDFHSDCMTGGDLDFQCFFFQRKKYFAFMKNQNFLAIILIILTH